MPPQGFGGESAPCRLRSDGVTKKPGTYARVLECTRTERIQIGKLGRLERQPGVYVDIGSGVSMGSRPPRSVTPRFPDPRLPGCWKNQPVEPAALIENTPILDCRFCREEGGFSAGCQAGFCAVWGTNTGWLQQDIGRLVPAQLMSDVGIGVRHRQPSFISRPETISRPLRPDFSPLRSSSANFRRRVHTPILPGHPSEPALEVARCPGQPSL